MLKFLAGVLFGVALAWVYVTQNISWPAFLELPAMLRGNVISSAVEEELYDLDRDLATRQRALEVLFANRAKYASEVDADFGHPFLETLYRKRARREALLLRAQWGSYAAVLSKPALRTTLVEKYGTHDDRTLKRKMLAGALDTYPFLKRWMAREQRPTSPDALLASLDDIVRELTPG